MKYNLTGVGFGNSLKSEFGLGVGQVSKKKTSSTKMRAQSTRPLQPRHTKTPKACASMNFSRLGKTESSGMLLLAVPGT